MTRSGQGSSRSSILLLSELFPPAIGGSGVLFANIYSRLADHAVTVLTNAGVAGAQESDARYPSLKIVREPLTTSRWGMLDRRAMAHHWRVARIIRRHANPSAVVHCGRSLPEGAAALLARLLGGPRYVCWTHGEDIATALTSRELAFLTRLVYRRAAGVLANSRNTAKVLDDLGVPPERIAVVYPGVDATRFHPGVDGRAVRARHGGDTAFIVLSVGRLQRRKGHDLALAAVAALRARLPTLHYVIVGSGEEEARLRRLVEEYGISDRVTMAGDVSEAELPRYYAACDLFLMPNRVEGTDFEGFGIVFLEAAATGKPVVGGRSGGVPEAVDDGVTGLLVGGTDPDELAETLARISGDTNVLHQMGEAGRARVLAKFDWPRAAAALSAFQDRLSTLSAGSR